MCGLKWLFINRRKQMGKKDLPWSFAPSCKYLWREASVMRPKTVKPLNASWSVTSESPQRAPVTWLAVWTGPSKGSHRASPAQVYYPSSSSTVTMDMAIPRLAWRIVDTFTQRCLNKHVRGFTLLLTACFLSHLFITFIPFMFAFLTSLSF